MANVNATYSVGYSEGGTPFNTANAYASGGTLAAIGTQVNSGVESIAFAFTYSKMVSFYATTDQNVTFQTNVSGSVSSGNTSFFLPAAAPITWFSGNGTCPFFSGNVTSAFVANSGIAAANSGGVANLVVRAISVP